ncbi:unnamed protein product, partial [Urochloa humidicola]
KKKRRAPAVPPSRAAANPTRRRAPFLPSTPPRRHRRDPPEVQLTPGMVATGSPPAILAGNRARRLEMLGVDLLGPASDAAPWRRRGDPGGGAARGEAGHGGQGRRDASGGLQPGAARGGCRRRGVCGRARRGAALRHVFPRPFAGDEHPPGLYMEHLLDPE